MSEYVIKVKNAVKRFKETCALDHVSLNFEKGQIHGLVGRNGSGKTVLFKCICGLMIAPHHSILCLRPKYRADDADGGRDLDKRRTDTPRKSTEYRRHH